MSYFSYYSPILFFMVITRSGKIQKSTPDNYQKSYLDQNRLSARYYDNYVQIFILILEINAAYFLSYWFILF